MLEDAVARALLFAGSSTETAQPLAAGRQRSTRVLVADATASLRTAIRLALDTDGYTICAEVGDTPAALQAALLLGPDICLLGIDLPGDAVAAAATITATRPETAVVILADVASDVDLFAFLEAGASGFLLRDFDRARLPVILRRIREGEAVLPRSLAAPLIRNWRERPRPLPFAEKLTPRESEVLELLRQGLTTAAMSQSLFVAPVTVRTHVASILKKLHVPDRQAAVRLLTGSRRSLP